MHIQKFVKTVSVFAAGLLILLLAALLGLQLFLGSQTAAGMLLERINAEIPGRISWQDQEVSLFRGKACIAGLIMMDPEGRKVLTAEQISLDAEVRALFAGELVIRSARVEKPRVFLQTADSGRLNMARVLSAAGKNSPQRPPGPDTGAWAPHIPVRIEELCVTKGEFFYATAPGSDANGVHMAEVELLLKETSLGQRSGHLEISAKGGEVRAAGIRQPVDRFHLAAALNNGRMDPLKIDLVSGSSSLRLAGSAAGVFAEPRESFSSNPGLDLSLLVSSELSELREMFGWETALSGPVEFHADVCGPARNPEVSVKADYGPGRAAGTGVEKIVLQCHMQDRQVVVSSLEAVLEAVKLRGRGSVDLGTAFADGFTAPTADFGAITYTAELEGTCDRISALPGLGGAVTGAVDARMQLQGRGLRKEDLEASGHVVFEGSGVCAGEMPQPLDLRLSARADIADSLVNLRKLLLETGASRLTASGSLQLTAEKGAKGIKQPFYTLTLSESRLNLQDFLPDAEGRVDLSGRISGTADDPAGRLEIAGHNLAAMGQSISALHLNCRLDGRRIHLAPLTVSPAPQEKLRVEGWVGLDRRYDLAVTSDSLQLSGINMLQSTGLSGRIEISASGAGSFAAPRAKGWIRLSGFSAKDRCLPDMRIAAELRDDVLLASTAHPLSAKLRLDLTNLDFSASAGLSDAQLAPFLQPAGGPGTADGISGRVSASLEAGGNLRSLKDLHASLHIASFVVNFNDTELLRASGTRAVLAEGAVKLPESRIHLMKKGYVDIRAGAEPGGEIHASAGGRIPAAIAKGLIPGVQKPEGTVNISLQAGGSLSRPEVAADIDFVDLGLTVVGTLQRIHGINGRLRLTNKALSVDSLSGHVDQGDFRLSGGIELERFMPRRADLRFSARSLPLIIPDTIEMQIDTDLELSGKLGKSRLTGEVVLLEGRYFKDFRLSLLGAAGDIGRRKRETEPRKTQKGMVPEFLKTLAIDIAIRSRQPFTVDNNLALLSIRPALRIQGTAEQPMVTGRAEVTQGTVTYRNTGFEVKKGLIDFVNPYRIEPTVDIRAESRVRRWTITLAVTGTPDNLDFHLSSEPPEEDGDILSLLAVGKTTRELASGTGGSGRPPAEMLADLFGGRLGKQLQEGTGLDIVEMEYRKSGMETESEEEVRVTVGKELSRRLTVKYGVERRSGSMVQQSTAIYKLLENLSVNAYQDTEGAFGGEMRYRLEFR
ncbi:MAG: translocation/assembly module TamB domain-containing protein [Desulfosalsimonadaceae bacterium]